MSWHKPIGKGINQIGRHQETKVSGATAQGSKIERTRRGTAKSYQSCLFSKGNYVKMSSLISVQGLLQKSGLFIGHGHPPATAGGTDRVLQEFPSFDAKPHD